MSLKRPKEKETKFEECSEKKTKEIDVENKQASIKLKARETKIVTFQKRLLLDRLNQRLRMLCMTNDFLIRQLDLVTVLGTMRNIIYMINLYLQIALLPQFIRVSIEKPDKAI